MSIVLSNSKLTRDAGALEQYLELTKKCKERAQKITAPSLPTSPKFNFEQCKYLADKLGLAVESADSFLALLNRGYVWFPSPEALANCVESFKLLYALSNAVESFIQDCCQDAWILAALTLTNVSEHISSVGFNLALWTIVFSESELRASPSSRLAKVGSAFEDEDKIVKKKASLDMETLSASLNVVFRSTKSTSPVHQLAAFVLDRLPKRLIPAGELAGSSQSSFSKAVLSLKQKELQQIAKGSAATVFRWTWLGAEVAVKTFYGQDNADFNKEVSGLTGLFHSNIISLFCFAKNTRKCSIVMEKMDGDLHSLMQARLEGRGANESPFGILEGVDIMLQIGGGMHYLHESMIAHRDLKSWNILVRYVKAATESEIEYVAVKVADFGVSKTKLHSMTYSSQTPNVGTTRWMAPELIKLSDIESKISMSNGEAMVKKYPLNCDMYSFAMVCYEILTGEVPFSKITNHREVKRLVLDGDRPQLPDGCPNKLKHLIERCWSAEASERPSFGDICEELRELKRLLLTPSVVIADVFRNISRQELQVTEDFLVYTESVSLRSAQTQSERASNDVPNSSKSKSAKGNFSFLMSVFLKFRIFGRPQLTRNQGLGIHFASPQKEPFGYLTNRVWPRASTSDWKLDVIFFEGNVGRRPTLSCRDTWLQRNQPEVFWPRDWLPQDAHTDIRVLVLEYCISETGLEGLVNDIKRILIFSDLWNQNRTWQRPIVLVGHSLGCTVIEGLVMDLDRNARQLSEHSTSDYDMTNAETSRAFLSSLRGCFFYAYPSYGLVKSHSLLKEVFGGLSYSGDVFGMEFWEGSERLQNRSTNFLKLTRTRNPQISVMSVIEGGHTRGRFVVQRPLHPPAYDLEIERSLVLEDSNHIEICKPVDRNHASYQELVKFLKKYG